MFLILKCGTVTIEHIKLVTWMDEDNRVTEDMKKAVRAQILLGDGLSAIAERDEIDALKKIIAVNTVNMHLIDEMLKQSIASKIQIVKGDGGIFKNDKR